MRPVKKVIVIGLDGLEPTIVEGMLEKGELPNLAKLRASGGQSRIATTTPAQTPVAWSTFATGTNPGGHGIYDFIRRDPATYLPDLALNRYEQKSAFLPPKAVNLRRGIPFWSLLSAAGVPSVVIRCPCTYPPDEVKGRSLSGMGVPDIRGGLGTGTFYTTDATATAGESENVVVLDASASSVFRTHLIGPRNPKPKGGHPDIVAEMRVEADTARGRVVIRSGGDPAELVVNRGGWSDWLRVKFKVGMLQSHSGMVRFHLRQLEPHVELYASPVNFDPSAPMFPISAPWDYADELARKIGTFYTTGMVEDHTGLSNGRFDESAYASQCDDVVAERRAMLEYELNRFDAGFLYCLFDTPDRLQHMFWRFREADHPANIAHPCRDEAERVELARVVEDHYRKCDEIVGDVMQRVDESTLLIVLSDHGFNSFRRGLNLNTWLHDNGFLSLKGGMKPGPDNREFLANVDWSRTRAYALGLGSVYFNLQGRERDGIVSGADAEPLARDIARGSGGLIDPVTGKVAVRGAVARDEVYSGEFSRESPDMVVNFASGYRVSWDTALGGVPAPLFEDNTRKWGGDHIIDPALVPGVLFMNTAFDASGPSLADMAPTILAALGVPPAAVMQGRNLTE
jgi:predicted AlkP superfamily phosphohydrolase/phosphomutase